MSKDCPNPFSDVTEDGKPREAYIPPDLFTNENDLFSGIQTGDNFHNFDKVALQVFHMIKFYLELFCIKRFGLNHR